MIDQAELMKVVNRHRGDGVVVGAMRANIAWGQVSENTKRDIPASNAMSKTGNVALGIALAQPNVKTIVFDGDGSLLMNLGSLVTIANKAPKNLVHILMDNGVYATTGGQPVPGAGRTDYVQVAKGAGYAKTYECENLEDFVTQADEIFSSEGPIFVWAKVIPNIRNSRVSETPDPRRRTIQMAVKDLRSEFAGN